MALTLGKDELLAQISPFYFGVDPRGRVDGVGPALARQLPEMVGRPFDECFEIVRPKVVPGRGLLAVMSGHVVQLRPVERPALGLRGQVVSDGGPGWDAKSSKENIAGKYFEGHQALR